ncbi:MAG: hypothetical protein CMN30_30090 [Sandaracinus sp.]|nr:hypothetical protein [Sandaracinus sp.]
MPRCSWLLLLLSFLLACDDPKSAPGADGGADECSADADCDDGLFCDGVERCVSGTCVPGATPCVTSCDESADECDGTCAAGGDGDGDGHLNLACGGDDCDDSDPDRFPGNAEVCDAEAHDEDCDDSTVGDRDLDGDGFVDALCCNLGLNGARTCGDDCDDSAAGVHPTEAESCNAVDDDCDGDVDEGLLMRLYYPDCDGDGFGDPATFVAACGPLGAAPCAGGAWVDNARDCDDADPDRNPDAAELCDGVDNDCDGALDGPGEDDDGDGYADVACGVAAATDCDDRCPTCFPGSVEDLCDGLDQDCDGVIDEGVTTTFYVDADGDGFGGDVPIEACGVGPGIAAETGDCDDREARVPRCDPRLACLSVRGGDLNVCGCRRTLRYVADQLDFETNTVVEPPAASGPEDADLAYVSGANPQQHLRTFTGVQSTRIAPYDWLAVGPGDAVGLQLAQQQQLTPYTVVIVRTGPGNDYKLGYVENVSGSSTFVYAPLGAIPGDLDCSP